MSKTLNNLINNYQWLNGCLARTEVRCVISLASFQQFNSIQRKKVRFSHSFIVFSTQSFTECTFPVLSKGFVDCGEKQHLQLHTSWTIVVCNKPKGLRGVLWIFVQPRKHNFILFWDDCQAVINQVFKNVLFFYSCSPLIFGSYLSLSEMSILLIFIVLLWW